ncbi:hypothetical protein ACF0H5_010644 [Mactra antiquata]
MAFSKTKGLPTASSETSQKLIVAALDFGTTFSGWAYSFCSEKDRVFCKSWNSGNYLTQKTPTTVLIQPDGKTLEAFGYDAENRYSDLFDKQKHTKYYYFQRFKMLLYDNKTLTRNEDLNDTHGKRLKAKTVFSLAIQFLKDDLLEYLNKSITSPPSVSDIQWVLTVPAIWSIRAKQFMRECAEQAGIKTNYLKIALEPEAASLHCKQLEINRKEDTRSPSSFKPGSQYMVVDAGGGTVDIVIHKVRRDGTLEEISPANGGKWGGTCIDRAFMDLLYDIYGQDVVQKLKSENVDDYLELLREIESKKKTVSPTKTTQLKLRVPLKLNQIYEAENNKRVNDKLIPKLDGRVLLKDDKLLFDDELIKHIFEKTTGKIVGHLKQFLSKETRTIIMVGGFSESQMLFNVIQDAFKDYKVISPPEAELSVLKGAVLYGHKCDDISIRVSPYTYGCKAVCDYDPAKDERRRMYLDDDGNPQVDGVFMKLIQINERIPVNNETRSRTARPSGNNTTFDLKLFASSDPDPTYVDESSCFPVGSVNVDCRDDDGDVGSAKVSLKFGGTEVEARAVLKSNGRLTTTTFNFLDKM